LKFARREKITLSGYAKGMAACWLAHVAANFTIYCEADDEAIYRDRGQFHQKVTGQ
jgi:hypothetical protein